MKLKKIASLMLAGVMAVSMLAGCSGNTSNPDDGNTVVTPTDTAIVIAVNDGQDAANDVKIDFTSDSTLDTVLAGAVKAYGETSSSANLTARVADLTNLKTNMADLQTYTGMTDARYVASANNKVKDDADGVVIERIGAFVIKNVLNEDVAMQQAAKAIDDVIASMKATSYKKDSTVGGQKYCDYGYEGHVSMVTVENANGTTTYCFAYTISQTTNVKTLAPEA